METEQNREQLTPSQQLYIDYLGAGQIDENGTKISKEQFAKILQVNPDTLYQWQKLPGFWPMVVERTNELIRRKYPKILNSMYVQALKGNVQAATFMAKQSGELKADKTQNQNDNTTELKIVFDNA